MAASGPARLVLVLQDLLFGGSQRHALELARRIDRSRFAPEFWMLARGDDFVPQARQAGLPLRWMSRARTVGPGAVANLGLALARVRPDIVMPLTAVPNIWARVLGRAAGLKVVATCRGGGAPARQHERLLAGLASHHICNTRALKRALTALGRPEDRVTVIANGVDTDFFAPPPPELAPVRQVVLCLARLVEDKDHLTLLTAFEMAAAKLPRAELWLVGEGPLAGRLDRIIRGLACRERIKRYPGGADPRPFYNQASALVLSSVREGLPNVILEGMACGLPVAATTVGGVPEAVEEGVTGLLSPAKDAAALAGSLVQLLSDEGLRARMGAAGRRKAVAEHAMEVMVRRHEAVLEGLLRPGLAPGSGPADK